MRVIALDASQGQTAGAAVARVMGKFPLPADFQVVHMALADDGTMAGVSALGICRAGGAKLLLGTWPSITAAVAERQFGGLQPWELLLRSQLWWALQHNTGSVLLAAADAMLAPTVPYLGDVSAHVVRPAALPDLVLPADWTLVRVAVQGGLDGLRAKRLASVLLARYRRAAGRARSTPSR
jgi:hypothetical protein